jgi:glycosyltransferase involved in cell wall biosynthesis
MAAGVPVVASAAGGHLETIGRVERAPLFPPGDPHAAALALGGLLAEGERRRLSELERSLVDEHFTIDRHVEGLLLEYERLLSSPGHRSPAAFAGRAT